MPVLSDLVLPDAASSSRGPAANLMNSGPGLGGALGWRGKGPSAFLSALPNVFSARCSDQSRLEKLRQNGGTPECEAAVSRSLAWLKTQQNADGSWGRTNKAAMTGLTLLCYLGRCETPDSVFYGDNVRNGMLYLVELARKNPHGLVSEAIYRQALCTLQLEVYYRYLKVGDREEKSLFER